jgi:serine/threonine protein kinase
MFLSCPSCRTNRFIGTLEYMAPEISNRNIAPCSTCPALTRCCPVFAAANSFIGTLEYMAPEITNRNNAPCST